MTKKKKITGELSGTNTMNGYLLSYQLRLADRMQKVVLRFSFRKQKIFWGTLLLSGALWCGWTIADSINRSGGYAADLLPASITVFDLPDDPLERGSNLASAHVEARITRFRNYLDSLDATAVGRAKKRELLRNRPGLVDSLEMVEQYFNIQK